MSDNIVGRLSDNVSVHSFDIVCRIRGLCDSNVVTSHMGRRRNHDRKTGACPRLAGDPDLSAVLLHDLLDDGQPDSGARFSRFFGPLSPVKLMKNLLHFF